MLRLSCYHQDKWPGSGQDALDIGFGQYSGKFWKRLTTVYRVWIDGVEQKRLLINPCMQNDYYTFPRQDQDALDYDTWHTIVFQKVSDTTYSYFATLKGFVFERAAEVKALPDVLGTNPSLS